MKTNRLIGRIALPLISIGVAASLSANPDLEKRVQQERAMSDTLHISSPNIPFRFDLIPKDNSTTTIIRSEDGLYSATIISPFRTNKTLFPSLKRDSDGKIIGLTLIYFTAYDSEFPYYMQEFEYDSINGITLLKERGVNYGE